MPDHTNDQIDLASSMPRFETDEKILNALKRSNAQTAKLIELGYYLLVLVGLLTICIATLLIMALLN